MNLTLWGKRIIMFVTAIGIVSMFGLCVVQLAEVIRVWNELPIWR